MKIIHHKFRFGWRGNAKVILCRLFGHRINDNPSHHWCGRCGLAYEEVYHNVGLGYWLESGILDKSLYNKKGNYKRSIEISGKECPLRQDVFEAIILEDKDDILSMMRRDGKILSDAISDSDILI